MCEEYWKFYRNCLHALTNNPTVGSSRVCLGFYWQLNSTLLTPESGSFCNCSVWVEEPVIWEKTYFLHNYKPCLPDSMNKLIFVYKKVCTSDESWWWQLKMIKMNWWSKTALRLFWLFWTGFSCHLFAFVHIMQISAGKQMSTNES